MSDARPVIGFAVDNLLDGYEGEIWRAALRAAEAAEANLLCFVGGTLAPQHARNQVFELVSPENVDALVVLAGSVGHQVDAEARRRFVARFAPLPVITIGEELGGAGALLVDSGVTMEWLVEHLVVEHGRRRVAFVRGPTTNAEADARFAAYRAALARVGLPYDPALVCDGDFERDAGRRAVEALLDVRRVDFDAVALANDAMALGALLELQRRGIPVPDRVAVTGFDDIADATGVFPALTTARQPLEELGRSAVALALDCARGERPAPACFQAGVVVRRSCGCLPRAGLAAGGPVAAGPRSGAEVGAELDRRFPQLAALHGAPGWAGALGEAAVAAAEGDEQGFLLAVEREVSRALRRRPDAAPWFDAVQAALALAGAGRAAPGAASLAAAALALVGALAATAQSALRIQARSEAQILRRVILPDLLGEASFFDVLRAELPRLGIRSFHLSRFVDGDRAQVACHYDLSGAIELTDPAAPFPSRRLVPGRFAPGRRHVHVVLPVFARSERLGFALCEAGETDPSAYETLTNQISTMVKLNSLLEEVRGQQRQLLDSAHQAGMAEVASGVLHGVGNLLNSVRVSAGEIEALAGGRHVEGLTRANELLAAHRADLASFFATDPRAPLVPEYYARVVEALAAERRRLRAEARDLREAIDLVRDSIRSLQSHTQDPGDALLAEPLDLGDLVDWVLRLEEGELARERVRVLREVPALPALHLPRAKLVHVLVALLRNAVSAMRETPPPARQLTIRAAAERGGVRLEIADTGRGIAPEDLGRIFTFGFATPSGGRGFGLHTAANTVGQLGGTLTADSAGAGRGATFTLVLPATVTS